MAQWVWGTGTQGGSALGPIKSQGLCMNQQSKNWILENETKRKNSNWTEKGQKGPQITKTEE